MKTTLIMALVLGLVGFLAGDIYAQTDEDHEFEKFDGMKDGEKFPIWSSAGSIGYSATGKRINTSTLTGDFNLSRFGKWTNSILSSGITYGDVMYPGGSPIINANSYFGKYKFEGYLMQNKKPYLWTMLGADSDEFLGYWGRYIAEAGLGYSFFGTSDAVLKTEVGYAFVDTNWINKVEIEDGEFHYWDPTHNGLARLIASIPIKSYILFAEEATYRHNIDDEDDYSVESDTSLSFKLTGNLSFKTLYSITYANVPGPVEELDPYGNVVTYPYDDDGDPLTPDVEVDGLVPADRVAYTWTNALVISFF